MNLLNMNLPIMNLLFMELGIEELVYLILVGLIFGIFTSLLAGKKGYSAVGWFFLGFFFCLVALLVAVGLPDKTTK